MINLIDPQGERRPLKWSDVCLEATRGFGVLRPRHGPPIEAAYFAELFAEGHRIEVANPNELRRVCAALHGIAFDADRITLVGEGHE